MWYHAVWFVGTCRLNFRVEDRGSILLHNVCILPTKSVVKI
jgi:hypothetical protein